jgi:hypothetical protein
MKRPLRGSTHWTTRSRRRPTGRTLMAVNPSDLRMFKAMVRLVGTRVLHNISDPETFGTDLL